MNKRVYDKIYRETHREKIRAYMKVYYKTHKERLKIYDKASKCKRLYGITLQDKTDMIKAQDGLCAICGCELNGNGCVDHNHKTGQVRGILCDSCNKGLGQFKDNSFLTNNATEYLEGHYEG